MKKKQKRKRKDCPYAAFSGNIEDVKKALDAGADVNAKDNTGFTALIWASIYGHTEIVRKLLNAGADVNAKTNSGQTALIGASINRHTEVVKILEEAATKEGTKKRKATEINPTAVKKAKVATEIPAEDSEKIDTSVSNNTKDRQTITEKTFGGRVPRSVSEIGLLPTTGFELGVNELKGKTGINIPIEIETGMYIPREIETEIENLLEYSKKHIKNFKTSSDTPISPLTGMLGFFLAKYAILNKISLVELLVGEEKN